MRIPTKRAPVAVGLLVAGSGRGRTLADPLSEQNPYTGTPRSGSRGRTGAERQDTLALGVTTYGRFPQNS